MSNINKSNQYKPDETKKREHAAQNEADKRCLRQVSGQLVGAILSTPEAGSGNEHPNPWNEYQHGALGNVVTTQPEHTSGYDRPVLRHL